MEPPYEDQSSNSAEVIEPPTREDGVGASIVDPMDVEGDIEPIQTGLSYLVAPVAASAIGERVVEIAESQRGVRETGGEDLGVPYQRYVKPFGAGPSPWCAFFVSWCYLQASGRRPPWANPGYVPTVYAWASSAGRLVSNPYRGCAFGVSSTHMGLVAARLRNGQILTIEGNWSDAVLSMRRPISGLWYAAL